MGEPAHTTKSSKANKTTAEATKRKDTGSKQVGHDVDQMLSSLQGDALSPGAKGPREVSNAEHRGGMIQQIQEVHRVVLTIAEGGMHVGLKAIERSDVPSSSGLSRMLAFAASMAVSGAAGAIAVWLAPKIVSSAVARSTAKFFEDAMKDGMKKAFSFHPQESNGGAASLKLEFDFELTRRLTMAHTRLAREWSGLHDHLASMTDPELDGVNKQLSSILNQDTGPSIAAIANQTVVAWTNFLARAKYGGMGDWDYWEPNGAKDAEHAVKLKGAQDPSDRSLHGNIDPRAAAPLLGHRQHPSLGESFGVMEIAIDTSGRLVEHDGYGMHLDNVGPDVRKRIRSMGQVRDLKINKMVRVCSFELDPPVTVSSLLITADGFVRNSNLGGASRVHISHKETGIRDVLNTNACLTDLTRGKETPDCHVDHAGNARTLAKYAEWAQAQPLSKLEG